MGFKSDEVEASAKEQAHLPYHSVNLQSTRLNVRALKTQDQAKKRTVCLNQAALAHRFRGLSASWQRAEGNWGGQGQCCDALRLRYRPKMVASDAP
ncbi:hypothetical protein CEP54_006332 [Fusarium duplospermum]|uniref:Uncharacterized protein n=1 Tax=Fusarium duplospermum TaxID=1325734 RepID=A0A428Q7I9_9HYPO|nr:hypothetical protein CEP54_006332 [Fusarium duplospermum]